MLCTYFRVCFIFLVSFIFVLADDSFDPYQVLRVRRSASHADIKRSYKDLARKWHPDKNKSPEAERQFVKINQAYELLSDEKRRRRYDQYGSTEEQAGGDGEFNPFADMFSGHFKFHSRSNVFTKHRINSRMYDAVLQKSFHVPYLIFVYSDWCMMCMRAENIWERVVQELEPLGYGIATVNSMRDGLLIDKLRINHEPSIVVLVDGRPISYRGHVIDVKSVIDFARNSIPDLVASLNDGNYRQWMEDNWRQRNKISAIMCGPQERPRLRFLLAAMRYRAYASFGYVALKSLSTFEFRAAYGVSTSTKNTGGLESFMIFNERVDSPVVLIQSKEIPTENLISALESNKFLVVPRLSSQRVFDELCPPESRFRQLCVILLLRGKKHSSDGVHLAAYREFVENVSASDFPNEMTRFVYVYKDQQVNFVNALASAYIDDHKIDDSDQRHIAVLWRLDKRIAKFAWLREIWSGQPELVNRSAEQLLSRIDSILRSSDDGLGVRVVLDQLVDEHGPVWYRRMLARLWDTSGWLAHRLGKEELFPVISVLGTLFVMILLGCCVNYMADQPPVDAQSQRKSKGEKVKPTNVPNYCHHRGIQLTELNASTYAQMVTKSPAGIRTIVILVRDETKEILSEFSRYLLPWKDDTSLRFGYVRLDTNVAWFHRLRVEGRLNTRCSLYPSGIVLSLNGYRRYMNVFYPPSNLTNVDGLRNNVSQSLGLDSTDDENNAADETELLDGLAIWLERLFEGGCEKYSVSEWPLIDR